MQSEKLAWRLLWVGGAGIFLTGAFTAWFGPHSASNLQKRLQTAADAALVSANLTAWRASANGAALDLEGVAPTEEAKREVVSVLKTATGVGEIKTAKVVIAPPANPFQWSARKEKGYVVLEGVAPNRTSLTVIHEAARKLYGSDMSDMMTLASGAPAGMNWEAAAVHGLQSLVKLENGTATLSGNELTVSGLAATEEDAETVATWVSHVEGGVKATSHIIGPPEWVASRQNGKTTLQGKTPSPASRQALLRVAGGSRAVSDKTYVAKAGDWQARAMKALPYLDEFERGEFAVQGKTFRISGEAPGSVLLYLREDMAGIDDGYAVEYKVSETEPDLAGFNALNLSQTGVGKVDACQTAFNRVVISNRIVFARERAEIARVSGKSLDRLVAVARACSDLTLEIRGHTDSRGKRSTNLALSLERAASVKNYLVERGLSADRLTAVGFGPDRPIATNRTESGRARNRRIEFRVLRGEMR
jgi:OmpA-OmpF porin, OOP family